jgi:hypothetical protein
MLTRLLQPQEYRDLAVNLLGSVEAGIRLPGNPPRSQDYPGRTLITLSWLTGDAQLRLVTTIEPAGVFPRLYRGTGDPDLGEGILHSWSIHERSLPSHPEYQALVVTGFDFGGTDYVYPMVLDRERLHISRYIRLWVGSQEYRRPPVRDLLDDILDVIGRHLAAPVQSAA